MDVTILTGHRTEEVQNRVYSSGLSKVKYPNSKHNQLPSLAIDAAPYPIQWKDLDRFYMFAGYVKAIADSRGIKIRCGADWDGDFQTNDQNFNDLVHFELVLD